MTFALIYRWKQIHSLARQNTLTFSRVFYFRQTLILIDIICYIIFIIQSYVEDMAFWLICLKSENFSLIWLIPILISAFQMFILRLEYIRRVQIMWMHKVFWTFSLIINLIIFILFLLESQNISEKIVPLIKLTDIAVLTIMSFFFYRQDIMEFEDENCWQMNLP